MTPIIPLEYSRKAIGRAGTILQKDKYLTEEYSLSLEVLSNWRASHIYPLSKIQNLLYKRAQKIDKKSLIAQRLKRTPSIINKLKLMENSQLQRMQDIGGCRAIVTDMSKLYLLRDDIKQKFSNHIFIKEDDYILTIPDSGYRGIHLIYKFQATKHTNFNNHLIEIQLRTKLQHAWATAVEILGTYLGQPLKASQGDKKVLTLLKQISMLFSYAENKKEALSSHSMNNLKIAIKKSLENQGLLLTLETFSVTTKHITTMKKKDNDGYTLLYLDTNEMVINIARFKKNQQEEAIAEYIKLEKESANTSTDNIVLVKTESAYKLKQTYPNYFTDSHFFIEQLKSLLR